MRENQTLIIDPYGSCVYATHELAALLECRRWTLLKNGWMRYLHHEDKQEIGDQWMQSHSQAIGFALRRHVRLRPHGSERCFFTIFRRQIKIDGKLAGFVGMVTELSIDAFVALRKREAHDAKGRQQAG